MEQALGGVGGVCVWGGGGGGETSQNPKPSPLPRRNLDPYLKVMFPLQKQQKLVLIRILVRIVHMGVIVLVVGVGVLNLVSHEILVSIEARIELLLAHVLVPGVVEDSFLQAPDHYAIFLQEELVGEQVRRLAHFLQVSWR